jgi:hypothetical protein
MIGRREEIITVISLSFWKTSGVYDTAHPLRKKSFLSNLVLFIV